MPTIPTIPTMKNAPHAHATGTNNLKLIKLGRKPLATHLTFSSRTLAACKHLQAAYKAALPGMKIPTNLPAVLQRHRHAQAPAPILRCKLPAKLRMKSRYKGVSKSVTFFIPKQNTKLMDMIADVENLAGTPDEKFLQSVRAMTMSPATSRARKPTIFFASNQ